LKQIGHLWSVASISFFWQLLQFIAGRGEYSTRPGMRPAGARNGPRL
jgi:hypothetical protein